MWDPVRMDLSPDFVEPVSERPNSTAPASSIRMEWGERIAASNFIPGHAGAGRTGTNGARGGKLPGGKGIPAIPCFNASAALRKAASKAR